MANDLNQCNFIGRLGKDPEIKFLPSGDQVATISISVGWKGKDKEGTEWIPVTAFGKLAEIMGKYLKKGSQVYISGRFKTDKYEKDGSTRYSTKIVADRMQMLDSKGSDSGHAAPSQSSPSNEYQQPQSQHPAGGDFADDIPFNAHNKGMAY
jgi:single-strand DNA-binding protein